MCVWVGGLPFTSTTEVQTYLITDNVKGQEPCDEEMQNMKAARFYHRHVHTHQNQTEKHGMSSC